MRAILPLLLLLPTAPLADAPLIILDQSQLPFDLGPGHPANSPARTSNSPNAAANSAGNTANAGSTWNNRPSNPANENRLIITADGGVGGGLAPPQPRGGCPRGRHQDSAFPISAINMASPKEKNR